MRIHRPIKKINKKGSILIYMSFIITAILIVLIGAVFAPMGVLFNTKMYEAGEMILEQTQDDLDNIGNADVRAQINASINNAKASTLDNIEINNGLFKYSWILIVGVTALVLFILTRRLSEVNRGFV